MKKDEEECLTLSDAIYLGEQAKVALVQEVFREGIEEGKQRSLVSQITSKFQMNASDWVRLLKSEQLDKAKY